MFLTDFQRPLLFSYQVITVIRTIHTTVSILDPKHRLGIGHAQLLNDTVDTVRSTDRCGAIILSWVDIITHWVSLGWRFQRCG